MLVGIFFGVDLTPLLGPAAAARHPQAPSGPNTIDDDQEAFVAVVLGETEDVWGGLFKASGLQYTDPKLVLFSGETSSDCGFAQSAMGPFYCPNDQTVYLDTDFFRVMEQQLGARGDFAKAYVVAHEVGHHVQDELGLLETGQREAQPGERARVERALGPDRAAGGLLRRGLGATRRRHGLQLTDADIKSALDTAARIGDDALQQASRGRVVPDSFTHGSSEQRQRWFYQGFKTGDPDTVRHLLRRRLLRRWARS